ncbi:MAG: CoA transferase, partial [Alphaproteobacteria bacterium]
FKTAPRDHWLDALLENDVPSAPIYSLEEALSDPQVRHLDMVRELPHPKLGTVKLLAGGVNLSDTPVEIKTLAPTHGEHTEEILARIKAQTKGAAQ